MTKIILKWIYYIYFDKNIQFYFLNLFLNTELLIVFLNVSYFLSSLFNNLRKTNYENVSALKYRVWTSSLRSNSGFMDLSNVSYV